MDLKPAYLKIGRIIEQILKRQVPVKTGALRSSLNVKDVNTAGGITFVLQEKAYGIFTDMGTGPYKAKIRGQWNPRPGKGKGGIRPRFWKTLSDKDLVRIEMIIEDELSKQIEIELQK
jgi:hypothetical protein